MRRVVVIACRGRVVTLIGRVGLVLILILFAAVQVQVLYFEEFLLEELSCGVRDLALRVKHQLVDVLAVLVVQSGLVVGDDAREQSNGAHAHLVLLVETHLDDARLEARREQLETRRERVHALVQGLQSEQAALTTLGLLVVQRPADVLEKRVVQELGRTATHPLAQLLDAHAAYVGAHVPVAMHEHRLEYEVDKVLHVALVFVELASLRREHVQTVGGTLLGRFAALVRVLTLTRVLGDAQREENVHLFDLF